MGALLLHEVGVSEEVAEGGGNDGLLVLIVEDLRVGLEEVAGYGIDVLRHHIEPARAGLELEAHGGAGMGRRDDMAGGGG